MISLPLPKRQLSKSYNNQQQRKNLRAANFWFAVQGVVSQSCYSSGYGFTSGIIHMDTSSIYENCDQYTAFPDADQVFYSDYEKEVMLPLGMMHVDFDGVQYDVLLAVPTISHEEGIIGYENIGERCGEFWITYSNVDGKWALDSLPDELCELEFAPPKVRERYEERKALFEIHRCLPFEGDINHKLPLLRLGHEITNLSNLFTRLDRYIPSSLRDIPYGYGEKLVTFESSEGGEYIYLGRLTGWIYCGLFGDFMFFFNTVLGRVLVVVDYD
jgi:hypothetical protein